jgi:acyl-coenzyme A thioesterase PaaI-like protein
VTYGHDSVGTERRATDVIMSVPELLFGLEPLTFAPGGTVSGEMATGPWMSDPDTGPEGLPGALGVLVDDVLGYAINACANAWSVSTEISLDVVGQIPTDGSRVRAEGGVVHRNGSSVFARGRVIDQSGATIAYAQERGRLIPGSPGEAAGGAGSAWSPKDAAAESIGELFGTGFRLLEGGADVHVGERLANPLGNLHGGMSLCLTEWLASRATPALARTSSVRMQYVRPLPGGTHATAVVTVDYRGRSLAALRVVIADAAGKPCTIGSVVREGNAI